VSQKPEKEEFDITADDIPNFKRLPQLEKLEEVVGRVMEEIMSQGLVKANHGSDLEEERLAG